MRPDPLRGLNSRQRLEREREDADYIRRHAMNYGTPEALARADNTYAGLGRKSIRSFDLLPLRPETKINFVVTARLDLDHPLYFPDNQFCDCEDCGCNLQFRPDAPPGPRLCICCAARRVAEAVAQPREDGR
jgi:hypothetical protein